MMTSMSAHAYGEPLLSAAFLPWRWEMRRAVAQAMFERPTS